jgi:hypothetical protein
MNLRPLLLSVAVLAPLAAAVWWFQRPEPPPSLSDARVGQRLAEPDALARAARIRLTLPSGENVAFARAANERWTVEGAPALPADIAKLARLSSELVGARIERLVTRNPDRISALGFGDTRIAYLDAEDKTLLQLDLGKTADGGGSFLRHGEEPRAYLARLDLHLDATAAAWRDTLLLPGLAAADIASLRIHFTDTFVVNSATLTRETADAPWAADSTPDGKQLKQSLITGQLTNLANLRYTNPAPRLDPAVVAARVFAREIELRTFEGRSVTVTFKRVPAPPGPAESESAPPAEPRPVYVEVTDSSPDAILAEAVKTHAFEVAEWVFNALPAKPADLFEDAPAAASSPAPDEPVSVTTEPVSIETSPTPAEK